ncbi:MAG TPA: glycosyltransferase, partial [Acidimicrobiales bacterium]|nr:glycosyltransferase [Acidimicrobiales bacterium]
MDGISVVMPSKDRCASLRRVLPSYLSQAEVAEVVVVIDGSTDGTSQYLRHLAEGEPRIKV